MMKRKYTDEYDAGEEDYGNAPRENKKSYGGGSYGAFKASKTVGGGPSREQREDDASLASILKLSDEQKAVLGWVTEHRGGCCSHLVRT